MLPSDQCAVDISGGLKNASEIDFYESESDIRPIPKQFSTGVGVSNTVHEGDYYLGILHFFLCLQLHVMV